MICTYLSVKDGCGSTTALLHTAQILSRRFLKKVCVIDFDTNYTGEHQKLLEQKESLTLRQYFESEFSQSPPLHHSGVAQLLFHQEGENFLSQKEIIVVLEELQKKYDVLLIDMGSQPNPFHFSSLLLSQYIFLFCQAQSFLYEKALEKKKRLLCSHIPEKRIKLICNFWENHLDLIKKEESIFTLPAERKAPFNLQNYIGDYTVKIEKMIDIFF